MIVFLVPVLTEEKRLFSLDFTLVFHIIMIHSFLLKGGEPSVCIPCDELLSTEHIIVLFCSDLIDARERHFTSRSVRVPFVGVSLDCTLIISRSLVISSRSTFLEGYNFFNQKITHFLPVFCD